MSRIKQSNTSLDTAVGRIHSLNDRDQNLSINSILSKDTNAPITMLFILMHNQMSTLPDKDHHFNSQNILTGGPLLTQTIPLLSLWSTENNTFLGSKIFYLQSILDVILLVKLNTVVDQNYPFEEIVKVFLVYELRSVINNVGDSSHNLSLILVDL